MKNAPDLDLELQLPYSDNEPEAAISFSPRFNSSDLEKTSLECFPYPAPAGTPNSPVRAQKNKRSPLCTSIERANNRHCDSPHFDARYLSVFLDTNSMSIPTKVRADNIAFYTNAGVSEEYKRTDNYKGGLHLIMRSLGKEYSLNGVSVLPSEIDIGDFKTPALDIESHVFGRLVDQTFIKNIRLDGSPGEVSALKKNLSFVYSLLSGIAYIKLYAREDAATHHKVKAAHIQESLQNLPRNIVAGINQLLSITDQHEAEREIKNFMILLLGETTWIQNINQLLRDLYTLDSKIFYEKNAEKIDQQYQIEEGSVSVFYWVSRMMYRETLLQEHMDSSERKSCSSSSSNKGDTLLKDTKNLCGMPKHVFIALNSFFDFIYDDFQKITTLEKPNKNEFNSKLLRIMDDLYRLYTEDRAWYADPVDIYEKEECKIAEAFAGTGYSSQDLRMSTQKYMANNKAMGQLIDEKFDVNDFALCLDAISKGMPILTYNAKMQEQVWGNLARALILGRDVQFIFVGHLLEYAKKPSINNITKSDLIGYCDKYLDTRHLWSVTNHQVASSLYSDLSAIRDPVYLPSPSPRLAGRPNDFAEEKEGEAHAIFPSP